MTFSERLAADQRLALLRVLAVAPATTGAETVLRMALDDYGHSISRDALRAHLAFLAELGLIETTVLTTETGAQLWRAKLAARGDDVAEGRSTVPGIARRRPD